jgi:hypothetical protein
MVVRSGSWAKNDAPGTNATPSCTAMGSSAVVSIPFSSVVDQLAVARYLEHYDVDAHVAEVAALYRGRRDAMAATLPSTS